MPEPAYITTPIYYVNDRPHIGHVYTTTLCDAWARFMRMAGRDVFFLTGTDEHGVKVEQSARDRGISPQELADENAAEFRRIMALFELTNDDFIRTTDDDHERQAQTLVGRLRDAGAVYLGEYEGWYDPGQEEYVTETRARETDYLSPISRKPLVKAREKNYYLRLSAFQERLERLFEEQPEFVRPEARRNEMLGRLREGLQDVPISRTNFTWGVPMPGDPEHVIYVWVEALMNYVTGLGLAEPDSERYRERHRYWPATFHVVGKEILWFHSIIWPAILMALELPLPKCVYAHSFWISEGQKMSKSLGNFIDLERITGYIDRYGLDMWRWYLITHGPHGATDADFSAARFHESYVTDLVNTLGNCTSRVSAMIGKTFDGVVPDPGPGGAAAPCADHDWAAITDAAVAGMRRHAERFELDAAFAEALAVVRRVDGFINQTEPFKLAKDPARREETGAILYRCAEALRIATILLWPAMPKRIEELWQAWSLDIDPGRGDLDALVAWGGLVPGTRIEKVALFPRVDAPESAAT